MDQVSPAFPYRDVDKLTVELFNEGKSYTEIALAINRTRSAVAGLILRLRLGGLLSPTLKVSGMKRRYVRHKETVTPAPIKETRTPTQKIAPGLYERRLSKPVIPCTRVRLRLITEATNVTFAELEPHHCKYPIGMPGLSDFRFCGARRESDKVPYCTMHKELTTRPTHYMKARGDGQS